jgi:integrase-like protein
VLFVFLVVVHCRRRILHFNITGTATAGWTAQQVVEDFPFTTPPRYLLRDRHGPYGADFVRRIQGLGMEQKLIAPRSPWQNPVVERLIGSIRRECLDHIIVFSEEPLRRILTDYLSYYHRHRTHRSLEQDCPEPRAVEPPTRIKSSNCPWFADSTTATLVRRQLEPGFPFPGSGHNVVPRNVAHASTQRCGNPRRCALRYESRPKPALGTRPSCRLFIPRTSLDSRWSSRYPQAAVTFLQRTRAENRQNLPIDTQTPLCQLPVLFG